MRWNTTRQGTGYRYASDAGWDDKIAAHIDNFAAYLGKDLNAVTAALTDNVSATEDNTSAVKEERRYQRGLPN